MAVQAQLYSENIGFPMYGSQDRLINPVSGLCDDPYNFSPQQQTPQLTQLYHHPPPHTTTQNFGFDCTSQGVGGGAGAGASSTAENIFSMDFSQSLAVEFEKQRREIDLFLQLQNQRLRSALQEERKQQLSVLLNTLESKTQRLIRQKDEELAAATNKTMELENCLKRAEMEKESWKRLAKANETMVVHLNNTLEQVKEKLVLVNNGTDDAESMCGGSCGGDRMEVLQMVEEQGRNMACKGCHTRNSCVLFLPCRHLCSCKTCEAFLGSCPVCKSVKQGSVEVFFV